MSAYYFEFHFKLQRSMKRPHPRRPEQIRVLSDCLIIRQQAGGFRGLNGVAFKQHGAHVRRCFQVFKVIHQLVDTEEDILMVSLS